jgi:hypothetical protein
MYFTHPSKDTVYAFIVNLRTDTPDLSTFVIWGPFIPEIEFGK